MVDTYYCEPCGGDHKKSEKYCPEYIRYIAKNNLIVFGRMFLPKDFARKNVSPDFHYQVAENLISTAPRSRICNIVPRGFGKSTLAKAAILHRLCFNTNDRIEFIPWICQVQEQAIYHINYIKDHVEYNKRIHYYFPHVSLGKKQTEKDFETSRGDKIFAVGMDQKVRGRVHGDLRYTGAHLDDFEGELNTKTESSRHHNKEFIAATILPSLEESPNREGWIWLSGTIVHYDSFLQGVYDHHLNEEGDQYGQVWDLQFFKATDNGRLDDDSVPLWPDRFSIEKLRKIKAEFESLGAPHKFAQELMNDARDESSAPIQISKIKDHYAELEVRGGHPYLLIGGFDDKGTAYAGKDIMIPVYIYMGVDPALVVSIRAAYSVIYILAIDYNKRRYTLEIFREKIPGFEISKKMVELGYKYPLSKVNIDPTGGSEHIADMYNRLSTKDRKKLPGCSRKDVKYSSKIPKEQRNIDALAPPIHAGLWYMRPEHKHLLADELWELPSPKYQDTTDGAYLANYTARMRYPRRKEFEAKDGVFEEIEKKKRGLLR